MGAERWIQDFPERIFLDRECNVKFPIDIPEIKDRIIHRIIVANGSANACKIHRVNSSGSLIISPSVVGPMHWMAPSDRLAPFVVGDIDPGGSFVHIFNETSLDIVLNELDTIRDFTDYLDKKSSFIRSGKLNYAHGEENLLAYYMCNVNDTGDHDFIVPSTTYPISIAQNQYNDMKTNIQYILKKEADEVSYLWDNLIEVFNKHMLDVTSITINNYDFDIRKNELGVRHMALVPRFSRRMHSQAIAGALLEGKERDKFFRLMMSPAGSKDGETAFFILVVKYLDWMKNRGGYDKYRQFRMLHLEAYARGILERYPHLLRVIGISREPPEEGKGNSEDLVYAEQNDWTEEDRAEIRRNCEVLGLLEELRERKFHVSEYPKMEDFLILGRSKNSAPLLNRKSRRILRAKLRKKK